MKRTQKRRSWLPRLLRYAALGVCGVISAFLLMAGYESVYSRDLPFIDTVEKVDLHSFNERQKLFDALDTTAKNFGNFGKPLTLKVPERALRLDIVPAVPQDHKYWLARANTMHLLVTKPPRTGNIGMAFLYCRASFRTIPLTALPKVGDNLLVDTDKDWRYVYRVTDVHTLNVKDDYIVADDGKAGRMVIVCEDTGAQSKAVIEATLLVVQGVVQQ